MPASPPGLRPLVPVAAAALLGTGLLVAWIRLRPLPMPPSVQVLLSLGLVVSVGAWLAFVHRGEGDPLRGPAGIVSATHRGRGRRV
jgi:hypothetical protein